MKILDFKEWPIQCEARFPRAIGYEEILDTIPDRNEIVVVMDTPRASITNKNTYGVLNVDDNEAIAGAVGICCVLVVSGIVYGIYKIITCLI